MPHIKIFKIKITGKRLEKKEKNKTKTKKLNTAIPSTPGSMAPSLNLSHQAATLGVPEGALNAGCLLIIRGSS